MLNLLNLFSLKRSPLLSQFLILLFYVLLFHVLHFHVLQFHVRHFHVQHFQRPRSVVVTNWLCQSRFFAPDSEGVRVSKILREK